GAVFDGREHSDVALLDPVLRPLRRNDGRPSGYRPQGYLFVAANERHLEYLRANYQRQIAMGLKTVELLKAEDVMRLVPQLRSDDIAGGSFCSTDGFVDPHSVMTGFLLRAAGQGAELIRDANVNGIDCDTRGVCAVNTPQGKIATRIVVNCAGAWAREI